MTSITTQNVEYTCDGQDHQGYAAFDASLTAPRPVVLVIHEWWGVNDYIRSRVDSLAGLGYCAFAIDMYGNGIKAGDPAEANERMMSVLNDMETGTRRLKAGLEVALSLPGADGSHVAAIGYCFGGAMALHCARMGLPLKAVVSFHGALGSFHRAGPGEIQAKVLICHGGGDAMVSMQDLEGFKQEMDEAEADYEVIVYPGAPHGFTSPEADVNGARYGIPVGYQEVADTASWLAMCTLFDQTLKS